MADFALELTENEWLDITICLRREINSIRDTDPTWQRSGSKFYQVQKLTDMHNRIEQARMDAWSESSRQMMFEAGALPRMLVRP